MGNSLAELGIGFIEELVRSLFHCHSTESDLFICALERVLEHGLVACREDDGGRVFRNDLLVGFQFVFLGWRDRRVCDLCVEDLGVGGRTVIGGEGLACVRVVGEVVNEGGRCRNVLAVGRNGESGRVESVTGAARARRVRQRGEARRTFRWWDTLHRHLSLGIRSVAKRGRNHKRWGAAPGLDH